MAILEIKFKIIIKNVSFFVLLRILKFKSSIKDISKTLHYYWIWI